MLSHGFFAFVFSNGNSRDVQENEDRVKKLGQIDSGKRWKLWEMICHGGKPFSTVGSHFPRWEVIFHNGILCLPSLQTPIHRDIDKGGAAEGRLPYGWVSGGKVGKEEIPRWQLKLPLWQFRFTLWQFKMPPWLTTLGVTNLTAR